jgi:hypothetical protein
LQYLKWCNFGEEAPQENFGTSITRFSLAEALLLAGSRTEKAQKRFERFVRDWRGRILGLGIARTQDGAQLPRTADALAHEQGVVDVGN